MGGSHVNRKVAYFKFFWGGATLCVIRNFSLKKIHFLGGAAQTGQPNNILLGRSERRSGHHQIPERARTARSDLRQNPRVLQQGGEGKRLFAGS